MDQANSCYSIGVLSHANTCSMYYDSVTHMTSYQVVKDRMNASNEVQASMFNDIRQV